MVNTGGTAVVCALAGSLPASSGFALTPGRFIMPAASSDGPLPAAEAAVSLLVGNLLLYVTAAPVHAPSRCADLAFEKMLINHL